MIKRLQAIEHFDIRPDITGTNFFCPSCVVRHGDLVVSMRGGSLTLPWSHTVIGRLDEAWRPTHIRRVRLEEPGQLGIEDARLFELPDGRLAAIATTGTLPDYHLSLVVFNDEGDVADMWRIGDRTKNWSPVADRSGRVLFSPHGPVLHIDEAARGVRPDPPKTELEPHMPRGGSQLIPFDGGFLSVVHEQHRVIGMRVNYVHRFVGYSRDLRIIRMSGPFYIETSIDIEYVAGLAFWRGHLVMTHGIEDNMCRLVTIDPNVVRRMLKPWPARTTAPSRVARAVAHVSRRPQRKVRITPGPNPCLWPPWG